MKKRKNNGIYTISGYRFDISSIYNRLFKSKRIRNRMKEKANDDYYDNYVDFYR